MSLITVIEHCERAEIVTLVGVQGPPGFVGPPGAGADGAPIISTDADNRIKQGGDGGLHVLDDFTPDPLAYYILAKG